MSGRSVVLGTAGHVDHGKSSLLRVLTGREPDRLPEERRRGMTIDLNFLWLESAWLGRIGLVDVPGHRKFLKNMVGGAFALDGFLFVVAADDGWMPQSEEHLHVLRGLGVARGLLVVTKTDLVSEARAREVACDAARRLGGAVPIVFFSTARPETAAPLRAAVEALVASLPPVETGGPARLWIDRVFSPKGLGVVVTGTLREGTLREGDAVTLWPSGRAALVKSLQRYHEAVKEAAPVSRVAVQLSRVDTDDVSRGMLLSSGTCVVSDRFEARLDEDHLSWRRGAASAALHLGTARISARVTKLADSFVRLRLEVPLPLTAGDRFVLRTAGEEMTVGAGEVIDPNPPRGAHAAAIAALGAWARALPKGRAEARIAYRTERHWLVESDPELAPFLADTSRFRKVGENVFATRALWEKAKEAARAVVTARAAELRGSVPEGETIRALAARLHSPQRPARTLLLAFVASGAVKRDARGFLPPGAVPVDPREEARRAQLRSFIAAGNGQPVGLRHLLAAAPELKPTLYALVKAGELVALGEEHYVARPSYESAVAKVSAFLHERGQAPTPDLKGVLAASRRATVLLLEQMDHDRVTYLKDGVRRLLRP